MTTIYIPVNPEQLKGKHIDLSRLLSFSWARVFGTIGARGYGKTFGAKKILAEDFIFDGKKMVVIRDTIEACEKICEQDGQKFWGDVFSIIPKLQKHTFKIEGTTIKLDNKLAGEVMPLSAYYKYKGNYYDADNILFDEFIEEKQQAYRGNRARQFVNTIETIIRARPHARVIMTANALDLGNDILELLDINIKNGKYGYYLNKDKGVVIYYAPDSREFIESKQNSVAGKLAKGSFLEANLIHNEFENDTCIIFEKRKKCGLFGIYYNADNECLRLYKSDDGTTYYVCKDINSKSYGYMRYVFNTHQIGANRKFAGTNIKNFLKQILTSGKVQFESKYLFGVYNSIINNTLKK